MHLIYFIGITIFRRSYKTQAFIFYLKRRNMIINGKFTLPTDIYFMRSCTPTTIMQINRRNYCSGLDRVCI